MIPAPSGLAALFDVEVNGKRHEQRARVVAFDDEGEPLIVAPEENQPTLMLASSCPGYVALVDGSDQLTAVMPAGGWRIERTNPDGSKFDMPLVGWGIQDGYVVPLETDDIGVVRSAGAALPKGYDYRIYHPKFRTTPARTK